MGSAIGRFRQAGWPVVVGGSAVLLAGCNLGTPPVNYPVSASTLVSDEMASGDLNADGATDLVVGSEGAYTVFLNDGAGGYDATEVSTTVPAVGWVVLEDLDSDGDLDMLAHDDGNTVPGGNPAATYVFLGDGSGHFGAPTAMGSSPHRASGDLDGDGHSDLVSMGSGTAVVTLGDGAGGFGNPTAYPIPSPGLFGFGTAAVADFTGEGDLDVVVGGIDVVCDADAQCTFIPAVVLLAGDGEGGLTAGSLRPTEVNDLAVADVDEDGALDVVTSAGVVGTSSVSLSLLLGDGAGDLGSAVSVPIPKQACEVEAADIDGDGHADLVLSTEDHTGIVLFGDGTGQFSEPHEIATAGGPDGGPPHCNRLLSDDLDGDATPDVVFVSEPDDTLAVLLNRLDGRRAH